MKNPAKAIRQALFTALDGAVTYSGSPVPVYTVIPSNPGSLYIWITGFTGVDEMTKDSHGGTYTIQVQTVMTTGNYPDKDPMLEVSSDVNQILIPSPGDTLDLSPDFEMISLVAEDIREMEDMVQNGRMFRTVTKLRMIMKQA